MTQFEKEMVEIGKNLDRGFVEGVKGKNEAVEKAAKSLVERLLSEHKEKNNEKQTSQKTES